MSNYDAVRFVDSYFEAPGIGWGKGGVIASLTASLHSLYAAFSRQERPPPRGWGVRPADGAAKSGGGGMGGGSIREGENRLLLDGDLGGDLGGGLGGDVGGGLGGDLGGGLAGGLAGGLGGVGIGGGSTTSSALRGYHEDPRR